MRLPAPPVLLPPTNILGSLVKPSLSLQLIGSPHSNFCYSFYVNDLCGSVPKYNCWDPCNSQVKLLKKRSVWFSLSFLEEPRTKQLKCLVPIQPVNRQMLGRGLPSPVCIARKEKHLHDPNIYPFILLSKHHDPAVISAHFLKYLAKPASTPSPQEACSGNKNNHMQQMQHAECYVVETTRENKVLT